MPKSSDSSSSASDSDGDASEEEKDCGRSGKAAQKHIEEVEVEDTDDEPSPAAEKKTKRKKAKDSSDSGSDSDSSDESEAKKKKAKGKKEKGKGKSKKKDKKDKKKKKGKDKKEKGKKGKKGKKNKAKKSKANRDAVSRQFGKYGIIKPEDFYAKKPEFLLWAMEVKHSDTDSMGQMQMKDLFKEFIEDYNTATMPSKKYYNLTVWDKLQTHKRSKKLRGDDMTESQKAALASFDDERARKEEIRNLQARKQETAIKDEVSRMRMDNNKVEEMKHQERLKVQMTVFNKTGNYDQAAKIGERLDPNRDEFGRPMSGSKAGRNADLNTDH